jgi:predicted lipoprotein
MIVKGSLPVFQQTATVVQYVPIPSSPFASYSPVNNSTFNPGQVMNILWTTTLVPSNIVTVILYSGVMGKQTLISVLTSTTTNNGSYSF